ADFYERRPQLQGGLNNADRIVNDAHEVVLKEIGFESIKSLSKICSKHSERVGTFGIFRGLCCHESSLLKRIYLSQYRLRVLGSYLSRVFERDAEFIAADDR